MVRAVITYIVVSKCNQSINAETVDGTASMQQVINTLKRAISSLYY